VNQKETIFYSEWLQVLQANEANIKSMILSLRKESAAALDACCSRRGGVAPPEHVEGRLAVPPNLAPDDSAAPHPLLVATVKAALNVGQYGGWEQRGYQTTSMQLITAALLLEKLLLSLFEIQSWNSIPELASNWWLQQMLGAKP